MEVLIAGNLSTISEQFFRGIDRGNKLIVYEKDEDRKYTLSNINVFSRLQGKQDMDHIFRTYDLKHVVYFSQVLNNNTEVYNEFEILENLLKLCQLYSVKNICYIVGNDTIKQDGVQYPNSSKSILMNACERLCQEYIDEYNMNISIIRTPFIYTMSKAHGIFADMMSEMEKSKEVTLPGLEEMEIDFVSDRDLGRLIDNVMDQSYGGLMELNISGDNKMTFSKLGRIIMDIRGDIKVNYTNKAECSCHYASNKVAREKYGWFPEDNVENKLEDILDTYKRQINKEKKQGILQRLRNSSNHYISNIVELAVGTGCLTIVNRLASQNQILEAIDFRIIFVVMLGTINGMTVGIIAGVIAAISYAFKVFDGVNWEIVFYNAENWLPFAMYFLIGAISGYIKDRNEDKIDSYIKAQKIMEDKYIFLNELYVKAIENKERYTSQIISYKDSYGKIYSSIQKLNKPFPQQVFYEAVDVMEDMLENNDVAIFTVDEASKYARLNVCSKSLVQSLPNSISLENYKEMIDNFNDDLIWVNTKGIKNYPIYAKGIFSQGKLTALICLMKVKDYQLNIEYRNKFNVITGLVKDYILNALEKMEYLQGKMMIPNTHIMTKDYFSQMLDMRSKMVGRDPNQYQLAKVINEEDTLQEISRNISHAIRMNDICGQGMDDQIYLLFLRAEKQDLNRIQSRLLNKNVRLEFIE